VKDSLNQPIVGVTLDASQSIDADHHIIRAVSVPTTVGIIRSKCWAALGCNGAQRGTQCPRLRGRRRAECDHLRRGGDGEFRGHAVAFLHQRPGFAGNNKFQFMVTTPLVIVTAIRSILDQHEGQSWTTLLSTNPSGNSFQFADVEATNTFRFYRVISP